MKNPDQENQNKIIEGYIKGEAREFFIVSKWIEQVVNNFSWVIKDYSDDIIQDVRLKIYINLKQNKFHKASMLKTYVYRITKYTCIDFLRKTYHHQVTDNTDLDDIIEDRDAVEQIIVKEKEKIVQIILEELAEICREILNMVFVERLSYREISAMLGIAEGTVKSRVSRCMKKAVELKEKYWNDLKTNTTIKTKS